MKPEATARPASGPDRPPAATPAEDLAAFSNALTYEMLPDQTVEFAKVLVSKTVAGALGGSRTPSAQTMAELVRGRNLPPEAGVLGFGFKTSLWEAVLVNVFTGHNSELEDVAHSPGGVSWDITVIPLALSLAERLHLSGTKLIEAIVAGLEVHYRTCLPFDATAAGMILPPTAAIGCAVTAAKAYGLSVEQTREAMGLALSSASMAEVSMGTDAHFFESALHAFQGLAAAEMARAGLTGNPDIGSFEGLRAAGVPLERAGSELFQRWYFEEMWVKKYPVCFLVHRQIDAVIEICAAEDLAYEDIERVEVHTGPGDASCDRPDPKTVGDLQFSFQHTLAAAMLTGRVGLEEVAPAAISDPRFAEARRKVSVSIDHAIPFSVSLSEPTTVVIRTGDGRELRSERLLAKGSPMDPLTRDELNRLFWQFSAAALPEAEIERTLQTIWELDSLADAGELTETLTFDVRRTTG